VKMVLKNMKAFFINGASNVVKNHRDFAPTYVSVVSGNKIYVPTFNIRRE